MIKRFLRRWLGVEDAVAPDNYEAELKRNQYIGASLAETAASVTAYKISNGFIIRTTNKMLINQTMTLPTYTYCKDAEAIANHIVADAAREAIGVGSQYELFNTASTNITGTGYIATQSKPNY